MNSARDARLTSGSCDVERTLHPRRDPGHQRLEGRDQQPRQDQRVVERGSHADAPLGRPHPLRRGGGRFCRVGRPRAPGATAGRATWPRRRPAATGPCASPARPCVRLAALLRCSIAGHAAAGLGPLCWSDGGSEFIDGGGQRERGPIPARQRGLDPRPVLGAGDTSLNRG